MNIQDEILLNQLAHHILPAKTGEEWFGALPFEQQQEILRWLANMAIQAGVGKADALAAIQQSGLKPTFTPCVLLSNENTVVQLMKIANLPANEAVKAFRLLLAVFQIADSRRRQTVCAGGCQHWWHQDLGNGKLIEKILATEAV